MCYVFISWNDKEQIIYFLLNLLIVIPWWFHWVDRSRAFIGYPINMGVPLNVKHNGPHKFVRLIDKTRWIFLRWVIHKFLASVFCFHNFSLEEWRCEWMVASIERIWDIRSYKSSETSFCDHTQTFNHTLLVCIKYNEHNNKVFYVELVGWSILFLLDRRP